MSTEPVKTRRTPVVLRAWYAKMLYIIAGIAIYYLVLGLVPSDGVRGILRLIVVFLLFILAARVFRSADEVGNDPRAWWRMTGRAFAGWIIGTVFGLIALGLAIYIIGISVTPSTRNLRGQEPGVAVAFIFVAAIAILYLTSSARLRGLEREARIRDQRSDG